MRAVMISPRLIGASLGLLLLAAAACAGGDQITGDRRVVGSFTIAFNVQPARVELGTPAQFTIRATNNGGRAAELTFPSGQMYDFWVTGADGEEVWRWSDGHAFTQAVITREVGPQQQVSFTESWIPDVAGSFTAHGALTAIDMDRELRGQITAGA